jgi:N-acetyl-anhydromuramyl-L-alanine amidase AmpD
MRIGDHGQDVRDWQMSLAGRGYSITVDGQFGPRTHNATLAFQAAHGLQTTGVVGLNELQVIAAPRGSSVRPPPTLPNTIPFVACRYQLRIARAAVDRIVLHCIECPEAATRAESCAEWMSSIDAAKDGKKSCHYFVDSDSVVQGVLDHHVAYHAPGANHDGIGIEHAGYARQTREQWLDDFGHRMLGLSVQLTARLCQRWKIPAVFVTAPELQLRKRGITTHAEVSRAFGKSDHTDPGPGFPIGWYVDRVAALLVAQQAVS